MSSVGSSESSKSSKSTNRQDETIRRNREEAKGSESELVKKQAKELRRVNEQHYAEMEKLKEAHNAQMNSLRNQSRADISARDHRYQTEIDEVRNLFKKQQQESADEMLRREETLRAASSGDLGNVKNKNEDRAKQLTEDFNKTLQARDAQFADALKQNKLAQEDAIETNRERLNRAHAVELNALKGERNQKISSLQNDFHEYRQVTGAQKREQDLNHMKGQQRGSKALLRAVQKERVAAEDTQENMREGFKDAVETTRERFEKAASRERDANQMVSASMKNTIVDRIDSQISRLEQDKADLKDAKIRDELMMKNKVKREVANITNSYQKNMDAYKDERDEAIRQGNERGHKDVEHIRKELGKHAVETNRYYRVKMDENNSINRLAYDNLKSDAEIRQQQTATNADQRVKTILELTNEEKARMIELQTENHSANQRVKQDEMRELRAAMEADKQIAVDQLKSQLQKQELSHTERMSYVTNKYEKQIQELKDLAIKERRSSDETLKRVTDELTRANKVSLDQLESQNRERIRQTNIQHSEEVRGLNKRHDEKMDQVIGEIKRS